MFRGLANSTEILTSFLGSTDHVQFVSRASPGRGLCRQSRRPRCNSSRRPRALSAWVRDQVPVLVRRRGWPGAV